VGRVVVTVTVVVALLAGCGGGEGEDDDVTGDDPGGPPTGLPVAFAGGEDGWPTLLATSDLLVGKGRRGEGDPSDLGQVVDLATGETWGLGRPETDPPFSPGASVALDDELVVTGHICPPGSMSSDAVDPCTNLATYRVDPRRATWTAVAPPAGTDFAWNLYATPDGAVGLFRSPTSNVSVLARLGPDGWEVIGPATDGSPQCATATELFSVVDGWSDSDRNLTATAFADGSSRPVPLPELGAAPVGLACGREALVITGSDAEEGALVARLVDGERWEEVPGVVPPEGRHLVARSLSGELAVVGLMEIAGDPADPGPIVATAIRADGSTAPLDDVDLFDTELVPRGVDGPFLALGPLHEEPEPGVDEPPPVDPVPLLLLPALA